MAYCRKAKSYWQFGGSSVADNTTSRNHLLSDHPGGMVLHFKIRLAVQLDTTRERIYVIPALRQLGSWTKFLPNNIGGDFKNRNRKDTPTTQRSYTVAITQLQYIEHAIT